MEVEILVAEIGLDDDGRGDQLFHILYDGSVLDDDDGAVLGDETEETLERFAEAPTDAPRCLADGVRAAVFPWSAQIAPVASGLTTGPLTAATTADSAARLRTKWPPPSKSSNAANL